MRAFFSTLSKLSKLSTKRFSRRPNGRRIRPTPPGILLAAICALTCTLWQLPAQDSQDALSNLAGRIAEKRSQVESLTNELELTKTEYNEQLRSLSMQKTDIEAQINREELRLAQIEQEMNELKSRITDTQDSLESIEPLLARMLLQTRTYIERGIPFTVDERLAEIDTLERLLAEGSVEKDKILARIWNMLESEFRMTAESGLYKQTIDLRGNPQLAEVARLGMMMMYFRTLKDEYGYVIPDGNGGRYLIARDRDQAQNIRSLFDSLRKNLREGFFVLPNPAAGL